MKDRNLNVLIITRSEWDESNSSGNTMSNLWGSYNVNNLANLYCRGTLPNNRVCKKYFSISDKDIIKSTLFMNIKPGKQFEIINEIGENEVSNKNEEKIYSFFRKKQSTLAIWGQELLWGLGRWKNKNLNDFLNNFKPDIIFFPCNTYLYMHKIVWYIQRITNAKVVLFHTDDNLNYGLSKNIFNRINRRLIAKTAKKSSLNAALNYCISNKQMTEYSQILNKELKILYKGADFLKDPDFKELPNDILRMVYIGTTSYGRWKTLGLLANVINKLNENGKKIELLIYSQYEPSDVAMKAMIIEGASSFLGKIPSEEVANELKRADIVLHVESFDITERLRTRLSFSTKIVDCFNSARCIFAIGWEEAASIDYLIENDAAIVATDEDSIKSKLYEIIENNDLIQLYARKAWECGLKNHQIEIIQSRLYKDLRYLITD